MAFLTSSISCQNTECLALGKCTILLCGKTEVGKSHLTNVLIGKVLAKEGQGLDPETNQVSG